MDIVYTFWLRTHTQQTTITKKIQYNRLQNFRCYCATERIVKKPTILLSHTALLRIVTG